MTEAWVRRLAGLSAIACVLCCAVPLLVTAGVVAGGVGALLGHVMPVLAASAAVLAGGVWWVTQHRRTHSCSGGCDC